MPLLAAADIHLWGPLVRNRDVCTHRFQTRTVQRVDEPTKYDSKVCHHLRKSTNNLHAAKRAGAHTHSVHIKSSLTVKTNYPRQEIRHKSTCQRTLPLLVKSPGVAATQEPRRLGTAPLSPPPVSARRSAGGPARAGSGTRLLGSSADAGDATTGVPGGRGPASPGTSLTRLGAASLRSAPRSGAS